MELMPGDYVVLQITDNGKGMDENTRQCIFDPYFTTKFTGRGLSMAATYGIIKNHRGEIAVESKLGQGTTVKVYLPLANELSQLNN
jgi:signal transduction histidine kinase